MRYKAKTANIVLFFYILSVAFNKIPNLLWFSENVKSIFEFTHQKFGNCHLNLFDHHSRYNLLISLSDYRRHKLFKHQKLNKTRKWFNHCYYFLVFEVRYRHQFCSLLIEVLPLIKIINAAEIFELEML